MPRPPARGRPEEPLPGKPEEPSPGEHGEPSPGPSGSGPGPSGSGPGAFDLMALGLTMALLVGAGLGLGLLVDSWLHSSPIATMVGLGVGVVFAGLALWEKARQYL